MLALPVSIFDALFFNLPGQSIHVNASQPQHLDAIVTFQHGAVRPCPQTITLPRLQGSYQLFISQSLELLELDLVQRFIPMKRPQGR
jgi:hypothetical protein